MAIIPRTKEGQRIQPNNPVPVGSSGYAGRQGDALQNVGQGLMNIGKSLVQSDMRITADQATNDVRNLVAEGMDTAKRTSAADGSDMQQKFNEHFDSKIGDIRDKYSGNPFVQRQIENYISNTKNSADTELKLASMKKLDGYNFDRVGQLQKDSTQRIYANPDPNNLKAELTSNTNLINDLEKNGTLSNTAAEKLRNDYYNQMGESLIKGMVLRKQYGRAINLLRANQEVAGSFTTMSPDDAKKYGYITDNESTALKSQGKNFEIPVMTKGDRVKLTPEQSFIMSKLDPNLRESMSQKLQAKMEEHTAVRLSDLNASLTGFEHMAMSGAVTDNSQVAKMKSEINSNPNLTVKARIRLMDRVNVATAMNEQMQLASVTPKSKMNEVINGLQDKIGKNSQAAIMADPRMVEANTDFATQSHRQSAMGAFKDQVAAMIKQRDKDPVPYLIQNDSSLEMLYRGSRDAGHTQEGTAMLKKYNDALLAKAEYYGAPQKLLAKQEVMSLGDTLKAMPSSKDKGDFINSIEQKYGAHFPRVMSELAASDPNFEAYTSTIYADQAARANLLDSISSKKEVDKEFKKGGLFEGEEPLLKTDITNMTIPLRRVIVNQNKQFGNLPVIQGVEKAIAIRAKHEMATTGATSTEAAQKAYDEVIGNQYHIVESKRGSLLVPKRIGNMEINSPERFTQYMDTFSNPNLFGELNVGVPKSNKSTEEYYKNLAPDVRWIGNSSQTGVRMMEQLHSGDLRPILDTAGKPIEKSYDEIYKFSFKQLRDKQIKEAPVNKYPFFFGGF